MWDGAGTRRGGSNAPTKLTATRSRDRARCEKRLFWGAIYILKTTVLPRQALDTRKKMRFSQVETYTPSFTYLGFRYVAVRCGQTPSFSFAVLFLIRKTDDLPRQARDKRATKRLNKKRDRFVSFRFVSFSRAQASPPKRSLWSCRQCSSS